MLVSEVVATYVFWLYNLYKTFTTVVSKDLVPQQSNPGRNLSVSIPKD